MPEHETQCGCTVTTTFKETPAGALIEHIVLECRDPTEKLRTIKPDRVRSWDWNR